LFLVSSDPLHYRRTSDPQWTSIPMTKSSVPSISKGTSHTYAHLLRLLLILCPPCSLQVPRLHIHGSCAALPGHSRSQDDCGSWRGKFFLKVHFFIVKVIYDLSFLKIQAFLVMYNLKWQFWDWGLVVVLLALPCKFVVKKVLPPSGTRC
jgi:hypothetical protein